MFMYEHERKSDLSSSYLLSIFSSEINHMKSIFTVHTEACRAPAKRRAASDGGGQGCAPGGGGGGHRGAAALPPPVEQGTRQARGQNPRCLPDTGVTPEAGRCMAEHNIGAEGARM